MLDTFFVQHADGNTALMWLDQVALVKNAMDRRGYLGGKAWPAAIMDLAASQLTPEEKLAAGVPADEDGRTALGLDGLAKASDAINSQCLTPLNAQDMAVPWEDKKEKKTKPKGAVGVGGKKLCNHCKSDKHLWRDCPERKKRPKARRRPILALGTAAKSRS